MIRHLLRLVWNRKRGTALLLVEILFSFLVLFAVCGGAWTLAAWWAYPTGHPLAKSRSLGFAWADIWDIRLERSEGPSMESGAAAWAPVDRLAGELRRMPEVVGVAADMTPPYSMSTMSSRWRNGAVEHSFVVDSVSDDFAGLMGLELLRGRFFTAADDPMAVPAPVVLDEGAAREFFGETDPVGKTFDDGDPKTTDDAMRVVGVVRGYRKDGELSAPVNMLFRRIGPRGTRSPGAFNLLVKSRPGVAAAAFEKTLADRLRAFDPELAFQIRSLASLRKRSVAIRSTPAFAGAVVAVFLLSMVALGLTGVLWQEVTRRTREIGLRRALGASGGSVLRQILGETAVLTSFAVVLGLALVLQLPLFGIFAVIPKAAYFGGIGLSLAAIYALTLLAALYPGALAGRLSPAEALRHD